MSDSTDDDTATAEAPVPRPRRALTVGEAAERLGKTASWVRSKDALLKPLKTGKNGRYRYFDPDVIEHVAASFAARKLVKAGQ